MRPDPGKFLIKLDNGPVIGVNYPGGPVVRRQDQSCKFTDFRSVPTTFWNVEELEGDKFSLTLEGDGRRLYIQDDGGRLVGSNEPPPSIWVIRKREGGLYTIEVPSGIIPTRGWTVLRPGPDQPVALDIITNPRPNQEWQFIPFTGPE